jgi:predicted phage terminase large subunit-like protein
MLDPVIGANGHRWTPTLLQAEMCRRSLAKFVQDGWKYVDPAPLVWSWHHDALCEHLSYIATGDIRFLLVNMPPRTSKSLITSVFYPAWEWILNPSLQFLTASYALQLSTRDTVRSRRLIESPWYQARWGHLFRFAFDEKTKRMYSNDKNGRRIALATESATTGEGGDRILVDDPHNASDVESEPIRLGTLDWWDNAVSSRLNNPDTGAWVINGQRTHEADLFGHIEKSHDMSQIVRLMLPNEYDPARRSVTVLPGSKKVVFRDPRKVEGQLLCPARISPSATRRLKKVMVQSYGLQYQQDPRAVSGAILPRDKWQKWEGELPEVEHIFTCWDTAFEDGQDNDYSARTDWGIFKHRRITETVSGQKILGAERRCLILLGAWRGKVQYPELKSRVIRHYKKLKPNWTLIEKKASGISLSQELRRSSVSGIRMVKYDHGGRVKMDKIARAHIASVVLNDEIVYYVERKWSEVVIDECSVFPKGAHDDYVDTCLMAWQWVRRMGEIELWQDEDPDDHSVNLFRRKKAYYG